MVAKSFLSCNSFPLCLKPQPPPPLPPPPPPFNSLISRRYILFRPVTISAPSSRLEQGVVMQSSSANKSTSEPNGQEDNRKISRGEDANLGQLFSIPTWAKLVMGAVVLLAIPMLRKSERFKDVRKTVEEVVEVVEKAAEVTEKVAEEIAEALPEGGTKEAAVKLEKIAHLVEEEAELIESTIDKVDEVVEAVDASQKQIEGEIEKINVDEENKIGLKKIVEDQSKEALQ